MAAGVGAGESGLETEVGTGVSVGGCGRGVSVEAGLSVGRGMSVRAGVSVGFVVRSAVGVGLKVGRGFFVALAVGPIHATGSGW